jgi:hypothetical protein
MKLLYAAAVLAAATALMATPAEAAKKHKRAPRPHIAYVTPDPYVVYDYDGDYLGRDPDPFIRLMIRREGKIQDQIGR